jgi:chromosome segregation ATPase
MPNSVADRYYLVKALLSGVVDTTSFHDSLYEKIEQGRQNTRQKNQYQENLKSEDNTLQTIKESIKNLEKELKEKQKALDMAGERANKPKLEKEVERVKESLDKLIEERDQATKNIEMYKQSIEYASNSTTHTSIWLLGQDK